MKLSATWHRGFKLGQVHAREGKLQTLPVLERDLRRKYKKEETIEAFLGGYSLAFEDAFTVREGSAYCFGCGHTLGEDELDYCEDCERDR